MHLVEISRDGEGLAASMSRMRDWFDANGIEPAFFGFDAEAFRVGFATARQAVTFARAFDGRFGSDPDQLAA
jgi:hypothetical protein